MAKRKQDPAAKIERKLTEAQAELQDALARNAKAEKRGNKEIEKARAQADQWKATAQSRVAQRQKVVAELETRLLELKGSTATPTSDLLVTPNGDISNGDLLSTPDGVNGLTEREAQVLEALRQVSQDDGAVSGDWQQASRLSDGTFSRVRKSLMDRGLVVREGDGRHVRYVLAQNGSILT